MSTQDDAAIAAEFKLALQQRGMKQAVIGRILKKTAPQISRLANGHDKWTLALARQVDENLGTNLAGMITGRPAPFELYVSSPITGVSEAGLRAEHEKVSRVVATLRESVNSIYWPGEGITAESQLQDADITTEDNIAVLAHVQAFLYVQFEELNGPSSSLIELGFALARGIHTTIIMGEKLKRPFMLRENFEGTAGRIEDLPDARVRYVSSVERACTILQRDGRKLLGLPEISTVDGLF